MLFKSESNRLVFEEFRIKNKGDSIFAQFKARFSTIQFRHLLGNCTLSPHLHVEAVFSFLSWSPILLLFTGRHFAFTVSKLCTQRWQTRTSSVSPALSQSRRRSTLQYGTGPNHHWDFWLSRVYSTVVAHARTASSALSPSLM